VLINKELCIGCKLCVNFCPYQVPQYNAHTGKTEKCTMCADRIDQGLQPACATLCPTEALRWGDWEQIQTTGVSQVSGFTDPKYTKPAIRFVTTGWSGE
jgi:Fe-S-cluster-containing dehydrogenase component